MKPIALNGQQVLSQILQLLHDYPELRDDETFRHDVIEGQTDLHDVLGRAERYRQEALMMAAAIDLHVQELKTRAQRFERRDDMMRKLMFNLLQAADLRRVELPEATLSIRDGIAKTIITDENTLPDDFVRIKREPDKTKIKQALIGGQIVPGASLSNIEPVLAIRTK